MTINIIDAELETTATQRVAKVIRLLFTTLLLIGITTSHAEPADVDERITQLQSLLTEQTAKTARVEASLNETIGDLEDSRNELAVARETVEQHRNSLAELRLELEKNELVRQENAEVINAQRSKLAETEQQLSNERRVLASMRSQQDQLGADLDRANKSVVALEGDIATATTKRERLEQALDSEEQAHSATKAKLAQTAMQLSETQANLKAEIDRRNTLQAKLADTEKSLRNERIALKSAQSLGATLTDDLDRAQTALQTLKNESTKEQDRLSQALALSEQEKSETKTKLAETANELKETQATLASTMSKLRATEQQRVTLSENNLALSYDLDRLRKSLSASEANASELSSRFTSHKSRIPPAFGGNASLEAIKATASGYADSLRRAHTGLSNDRNNSALKNLVVQAQSDLQASQLLLAGALEGALGVYRLQPRDTLSRVADRQYGNAANWRKIYDANSHILDDPNQVLPGMTIVLP